MIKVSVLVPIYGVEAHIEQCAESLLGQTWPMIEYIFVDDCSPDRSVEILKEVVTRHPERAKQVNIIRQPNNLGVGAARRRAFELATGDFIFVADSDDFVPLNAIETLVKRQQATGADLIDGAWQRNAGGPVALPFRGGTQQMVARMLLHNTQTHQFWARLIRRSILTENHILPIAGIDNGDDYAVMPRVMMCVTRAWTDEVVYNYRDNDASTFRHEPVPRHERSFLRANAVTAQFVVNHPNGHPCRYALQVGLMDVYGRCLAAGFSREEVGQTLAVPFTAALPAFCCRFLYKRRLLPLLRAAYRLMKAVETRRLTLVKL